MNACIQERYDVVIMGAGLAGLTLARQLSLWLPHISVILIEQKQRPLAEAAHKVGESSVEIAGVYFADVLKLRSYFEVRQIEKMGLRFFYNSEKPLHLRPEIGLSRFPGLESMQIDRGRLENDLRELVDKSDAQLLEGYKVTAFGITEGDQLNWVDIAPCDDNGNVRRINARWLIDASGRRRMIQRKLNLEKECGIPHSSAWMRYPGKVDVTDLVDASERSWHARVPSGKRYNSTTHLHSKGSWVWVIPLSSDHTSVGICISEAIHDFGEISSAEKALQWIRRHEPQFWEYIKDKNPVDFLYMKKYNHSAQQIFSWDRWACVGESGIFPDPYLSNGSNLIAGANTIACELIADDLRGSLTKATVDFYDKTYIHVAEAILHDMQGYYPFMGEPLICAMRYLWSLLSSSGVLFSMTAGYLFEKGSLRNEAKKDVIRAKADLIDKLQTLRNLAETLLHDWSRQSRGILHYDFLDYLAITTLGDLWKLTLNTHQSPEELGKNIEHCLDIAEATLIALFLLAVEDVLPDRFDEISAIKTINIYAVGLDESRWAREKLLEGPPRSALSYKIYYEIRDQLRINAERGLATATPDGGPQMETADMSA